MSRWTNDQLLAIEKRERNLLVSAAAGAGKTAVLVERIIRRILDRTNPVNVDRLLVVTFTNAAAQEMKERIGAELAKRHREDPADRHVHKQLLLLGHAQISTIHAFCLDLIRKNCCQLQLPGGLVLDPRFRVADDVETVLLKAETLEALFEEKFAREDPLFLELAESYGGERDDKALGETVLRLYEFSRSHCCPGMWLEKAAQRFRAGIGEEPVCELLAHAAQSMAIPVETALHKLTAALHLARQPGGPAAYIPYLQVEILMLQTLLSTIKKTDCKKDWRLLWHELGAISFERLRPLKNSDADERKKELVQSLRNEAKKVIQQVQKELLARSPEEFIEDMKATAPLMEHLCGLVRDFSLKYLEAKLERNIIDFSDIEHFTISLLCETADGSFRPSPLAVKLREKFEEIMIDEYQDINNVQEMILTILGGKTGDQPHLFMVGDVKQSIYGFRLAEPGLFLAKLQRYQSQQDEGEEQVTLSSNFRSRENIINGVNYVFRQLMGGQTGQVGYDRDAELVYGAGYPEGSKSVFAEMPLEVHLIRREGNDFAEENGNEKEKENNAKGLAEESLLPADSWDEEEADALQLEARAIGSRITALREREVWDKERGEYRPVRYSDMVVLLRSVKLAAPIIAGELQQMGIPTFLETGTGFLAVQEVQTVLSLLKIIDNPHQDIPLAAVLRSPIMGLTAADLAKIRLYRRKDDFYNAVRLAARREKGELGNKLRQFLKDLRGWRTYSRRNVLSDLIWRLYRDTGYYDYAGAMYAGGQKQANLRALYDRAKQFEQTALRGLFNFLRFLEKIEESGSDLGTAPLLGEKADVVRVMSVHKSKGLEFPVVFLAGLGKKFNLSDLYRDVLLHKELGLGPVRVDSSLRVKYPTLAKIALRNKLKEEMLAEEMRILYVAMTRAREHLVLVGCVNNLSQKAGRLVSIMPHKEWGLPLGIIGSASSYLDWLLPVFLRHPDGAELREMAGLYGSEGSVLPVLDDPSKWTIRLYRPEELKSWQSAVKESEKDLAKEISILKELRPFPAEESGLGEDVSLLQEWVAKRLGWKYPYERLTRIPAKLSVTEIKNRYRGNQSDEMGSQIYARRIFTQRPLFLQEEKELSAAEKGSALHLVMRHLQLSSNLSEQEIRRQAEKMVVREIITGKQYESISYSGIAAFFRSELGERLLKSPEVVREVPFTMALPLAELPGESGDVLSGGTEDVRSVQTGDVQSGKTGDIMREKTGDVLPDGKIIVQGTIDCLFREAEGYVIVDYKTDRVEKKEDAGILASRYGKQMELYARAVEICLSAPVKEKNIYSFSLHKVIKL